MIKNFIGSFVNNLPAKYFRYGVNLWLPFVGAGISVTKISDDFRNVEVKLKLHWYNKNYVGVHFGGSIFSMTDAFDMLILIKNLGNEYIVWDKAAKIDYKKPGRSTLHASFSFNEEELRVIREKTANNEKYVFDKPVDVIDDAGEVIATVVKTLYVRKKMA